MNNTSGEIEKRQSAALAAIQHALKIEDEDSGVPLFASHHIDELDSDYWQKQLGKPKPSPQEVIGLLVLQSHWSEEDDDGIDTFDFTLPDEITDYLISVEFNEDREVESISMES